MIEFRFLTRFRSDLMKELDIHSPNATEKVLQYRLQKKGHPPDWIDVPEIIDPSVEHINTLPKIRLP